MSLSANRSLILWISLIWQCTTLLQIGEPEQIQQSTVRKRRRHLSTTSAELQSPGAIAQIIFLSVLIWLYQIKKIKIGISLLPNCAFPEPCLLTNQRFLAVISFGIISWSLKKLVYKLKDLRSLFWMTGSCFNNIVGLGHPCNAETSQWKSCPSFFLLQVMHITYFRKWNFFRDVLHKHEIVQKGATLLYSSCSNFI